MLDATELNILLVEDEEADAVLTMHALKQESPKHKITWVEDGEAALKSLAGEGPNGSPKLPDVILLDLNLPQTDGHAVLRKIKATGRYKSIPVFMLTHSSDTADVERTFLSWADTYMVKPLEVGEFADAFEKLLTSKGGVEFTKS